MDIMLNMIQGGGNKVLLLIPLYYSFTFPVTKDSFLLVL